MRKKIIYLALVVFLGTMLYNPSYAGAQSPDTWAIVEVVRVIQSPTRAQVRFTEVDGVFTNKIFNIHEENAKEHLAILLTALSLNRMLYIGFENATSTLTNVSVYRENPR